MPRTADSKPRNKWRRRKFQESLRKGRPSKLSFRSFKRRGLCRAYLNVVAAQKKIEMALRKEGISWRTVEKAVASQVKGKWSALDKVSLPVVGVLRDYFASIEKTEEKELVPA